jgi:hypothetical protein
MRNTQLPPALICIGLVILLAAAYSPSAPVVTAMAIIALGSTEVIVARFRNSTAALPVLVLHGITYLLLYSLFAGARLHLRTAASTSSLNALFMLDLAASAILMTVALSRIFNRLRTLALSRQ